MFNHETRMRHLLRPEHYHDPTHYRTELRRLFYPGWHLIGTIHDLPRPGDYFTLDLCETPVLVRNMDGEIHAFLNVCAHRHCLLTGRARGRQEKLRCQYHGWEYDQEGRTGKIPDAPSFRPFDREGARLRKFRLARCGELLFLSLQPDGPDLVEFLGPLYPTWSEAFSGRRFRLGAAWDVAVAANWKLAVENGLESYHIPEVHPKTFKRYPDEDRCYHVLEANYSTFRTPVEVDLFNRAQCWLVRALGGEVANVYEHQLVHPNLLYSSLDVHRLAMAVYPTSPSTCLFRSWLFTLHHERPGPFRWLLARYLRLLAVAVARRILAEDTAIFPAVQGGVRHSPHRGVIGRREERLYVFQEYVLNRCEEGLIRNDDGCPAPASPTGAVR